MRRFENDIYHVRLNTGEDLISEVFFPESNNDPYMMLVNPMKIICLPSKKQGFVTLSLMQWIFTKITEEQEFPIHNKDILTMSRPNPNLKEYYTETVDFFNKKTEDSMLDYLEELEKEIEAVETSDKIVDEGGDISPELEKIISEYLSNLSSNNKGTLH